MYKLKNCPFCGSNEAHFDYRKGKYGAFAFVVCECCSARTKSFIYGQEQALKTAEIKARLAWNRRAYNKHEEEKV